LPIDWFTVAAQAVNFVILVALLTRFLYRPLTRVIAEREAKIGALLDDAARRTAEADERARRLEQEEHALAARRRESLDALEREVETERSELLDRAREEVERRERDWRAALERRRAEILDRVARAAVSHLAEALRAALADLTDAELEARAAAAFLARFAALDDGELAAFADEIARAGAVVRSSRPLAPPLREEIERRLADRFGPDLGLSFEVDPALVCGLELRSGGRRLAWTAAHYVAELEDELRRQLAAEEPEAAGERRPATPAAAGGGATGGEPRHGE
jgi:F-type H+-transporting ATPase subunit b